MTDPERAEALWLGLNECKDLDAVVAFKTVTNWLEYHGAGSPYVPFFLERIRDDARFWASCASDIELEAYAVASIQQIEKTTVTTRAVKRLAAFAWGQMGSDDRAAFKNWIGKQ